jgi:PAS domain S-box-containing protein
MINNESVVLGAMELASFKTFQPYEIDFVKRVGEMIVSAISSLKNSEKTQILLADAQRASERLRLQEEATRHQVQILQHQQEELSHAKALLKEQAASVELASCVLELDMNAMILQANDILLQILGYAPEDLVGESYGKLIGEREINSAEYYHFWQNVTEGVNQNLELRFFTKQGADVWFLASFVAVRNAEHQLYKILALMSEITTQKRTQIQLKAKLESLYLSLPVIEFTQHGIIMDANELYLRLTEYTLDELKGKPHRLVLSWNEQNTPEYQDFWFKLGEGEAKTGTFCHIAHSGREVWFKGTYQPMHDDAGNVFRVVLWAQEITQEKIHQQQNEPVSFEI